jgi:hypothetical protein
MVLPSVVVAIPDRVKERINGALWYAHISEWLSDLRLNRRVNWLQSNSALIALEVFVLMSLVAAWIIPLFK